MLAPVACTRLTKMPRNTGLDNTPATNAGVRTVADLIAQSARLVPDSAALISEDGVVLSYRALSEKVSMLAAQLAKTVPSTGRRPRIGIVLPNGPDLSVTLLAGAIAGECTPFNPALTAAEFKRYFSQTRISALVVSKNDEGPAAAVATVMGLPLLRLTPDGKIVGVSEGGAVPAPAPQDIALVLMTSGSTGVPKIVPLSHRNVCCSASDVVRSVALEPQDRCLVMWQQFHIGGLVDLLLAPLLAGSALLVTRGFNEALFFELLEKFQPTWFQGVPTTLGALVQHAQRHALAPRRSSLRFIRSVAAALTPKLQNQVSDLFGVPVIRTLGMTEASPLITSTGLSPEADKPGSVGRPCGPELSVFGPAMKVLDAGQPGEIAIKGENVFLGYENNPEANHAAFRDGWFLTGDNGYLDSEGDLFLTGRAKEQINRGGYKIMPSEVEEALSRHPFVHEAAVFGLAHPTLGEDIAAAVSLTADSGADAAELRTFLSNLLAANKIPGRISIMPELPRNPVGKLDRMALSQSALAQVEPVTKNEEPRDEMEGFLVGLWSRELALPTVGIHHDFTALGGDSLSALRICLAMETVLGRSVPDDFVSNFNSVAQAAMALSDAGYRLSKSDSGDVEATAERAFAQTSIGTEDLHGADAFATALRTARNKADLKAAFEGLIVYETPATIRSALQGANSTVVCQDLPGPLRYLMKLRFRQDAGKVIKEIDGAGKPAIGWSRKNLNTAAVHFAEGSVPVREKTLIVGFTGNLMRLQLPTYQFLLHLNPARFDLLLLRDMTRNLFANGLPNMGNNVKNLGAWLEEFATTNGYARRIALGTSGGGLAAIHTALAFGWERAVAASPPSPSIHAELERTLSDLAVKSIPNTTEIVISNARNERDIGCAQQILNLFPEARHDFHGQFTSHNVLNSAKRAGSLQTLFASWFD